MRKLETPFLASALFMMSVAYAAEESPPRLLTEPVATDVMVRVVAHGAMVLAAGDKEVVGLVTILDDVEPGTKVK